MAQMKEQTKTPEKELGKMEANNLLDAEFKTLVIRMLNELRGREDELRTSTAKEKHGYHKKKNPSEMKYTLTERRTIYGNR